MATCVLIEGSRSFPEARVKSSWINLVNLTGKVDRLFCKNFYYKGTFILRLTDSMPSDS